MPLDQIDVNSPAQIPEKEMSFLEHLEELRWHIMRSVIVIVVIGIGLFLSQTWLFEVVIYGPSRPDFWTYKVICSISEYMCFEPPAFNPITIGVGEPFIIAIKVSFVLGFIVSFPYVFWEFWRFIKPGLYEKEKSSTRGIVFICSFLFLLGVLFGYYIISPFAVSFLIGYTIPGVENTPTLASYINYMIMFTAPAGLIFELPIVVYFFAKLGLVTGSVMRRYRRHAIIGVLVISAVITPPDIVTQFLIGIPLFILYELSIFIADRIEKQEEEKMK